MGAHLYWTIVRQNPGGAWCSIIRCENEHSMGAAAWSMTGWDKFAVPAGFGSVDSDSPLTMADGYLTHEEIVAAEKSADCPWCEPYWVRRMSGQEFVAIVRERRWNTILDGIYGKAGEHDHNGSAELRAAAALVATLLEDGQTIRVTCWES